MTFAPSGTISPPPPPPCPLSFDVVKINEFRSMQPGPDTDEYIELFGPPQSSLCGLWLLVIGDAGQNGPNQGVLEQAVREILSDSRQRCWH